MKKLISAIAFCIFLLSCATMAKSKALLAEYYETRAEKTYYITEQVFPERDVFWVLEEARNGDDITVPVVWVDQVNASIAVIFDDATEPNTYDYCGIMYFNSIEDMNTFLNEFDTAMIDDGRGVQCGLLLQALVQEIERGQVPRKDVAND